MYVWPSCLPAAIPQRIHRISSELRSYPLQGPVSTGVGDRLGSHLGAASFFEMLTQATLRLRSGGDTERRRFEEKKNNKKIVLKTRKWKLILYYIILYLYPPISQRVPQPLLQYQNLCAYVHIASGHTATNTPDLFRTPKLTVAGPGQYWGGGPPGKSFGCC